MRGERSKHEKIVIIKNLFAPELFEKEVHLILDYQNDLREECSKCGTVKKVIIYDVSTNDQTHLSIARRIPNIPLFTYSAIQMVWLKWIWAIPKKPI